MAWIFSNSGEEYVGETHELFGKTYSGATRTPESRRLEFVKDKPVLSSKPSISRSKKNA